MCIEGANTRNMRAQLRPVFLDYLYPFRARPAVEGIVILGGASETSDFPFLDEYSDLDAALFISVPIPEDSQSLSVRAALDRHQHLLPSWLPPFEIYLPCVAHPAGEVEVNIHQHVVELEEPQGRTWDEAQCQAYVDSAEIFFDRQGRVKQLIREKTDWDEDEAYRTLIRVLGQAKWYGSINPKRQLRRGFPHHAHDLLNKAIDLIVYALYLINRRYRPHKKWRLERSTWLPLRPDQWRERVGAALIVESFKARDIERRIGLVTALLDGMVALASKAYVIPNDCYQASCRVSYDDRQIRRETI